MSNGDSQDFIYFVSGMWCSTCAKSIREAVSKVEGVESADINYASKLLVVHAKNKINNSLTDEAVRSKVAQIGFGIVRQSEGWIFSFQDQLKKESEKKISWLQVSVVWFLAMWSSMLAFTGYISGDLTAQETFYLSLASTAFGLPAILIGIIPYANAGLRALLSSQLLTLDFFIFIGGLSAIGASLISLLGHGGATYADSGSMVIAILLLTKKIENAVVTSTTANLLSQLGSNEAPVEVLKKGVWTAANASQIKHGDMIRYLPDQVISLDGVLASASAQTNNHLLNGENAAVSLTQGDHVFAGAIAYSPLEIRVTAPLGTRKIDAWAETALLSRSKKSKYEKLASKIENYLSLTALAGAALIAALAYYRSADTHLTAESFFVGILVFCPCLFASIIPLTRQITRSALLKAGVFLQSDDALWDLPQVSHFYFDKTGTLESVESTFVPLTDDTTEARPYLNALIVNSSHITLKGLPISGPIAELSGIQEVAGMGVVATAADGTEVTAGKPEFLKSRGFAVSKYDPAFSLVAVNRRIMGQVMTKNLYNSKSHEFLKKLMGLIPRHRIEILSGDPKPGAGDALREVNENIVYMGNLSPEQKAARVLADAGHSAFVGDGLNDTLALAKARVSFRLGSRTQSFAPVDFHLRTPNLDLILASIQYAKKYRRVVLQTSFAALLYNVVTLTLASLGKFSPLGAVLSMLFSFSLMLLSVWRLQYINTEVP